MVIHDGFVGLPTWDGFLEGADRLAIESHFYFAFSPTMFYTPFESYITFPCTYWAAGFNTSILDFGITSGGEWSLASKLSRNACCVPNAAELSSPLSSCMNQRMIAVHGSMVSGLAHTMMAHIPAAPKYTETAILLPMCHCLTIPSKRKLRNLL